MFLRRSVRQALQVGVIVIRFRSRRASEALRLVLDNMSVPADADNDGICDALDPSLDLPFTLEYPTQYLDLFENTTMDPFLPVINGSGDVTSWELEGDLPEGLTFGWSPARDAYLDGSIRGTPTGAAGPLNVTVWANNSAHSASFVLSVTVTTSKRSCA